MPKLQKSGWTSRAAKFLKIELKRADMTYLDLAQRLKKHGVEETHQTIASKLARASFSAEFLLASVAAIGLVGVQLEDL